MSPSMLADFFRPEPGRLSPDDLALLSRIAGGFPAGWRVANLWPARAERRALSRFSSVSRSSWNLSHRAPVRYDVVVAARLGEHMGSERALSSALASTSLLLVLDSAPFSSQHPGLQASVPVPGGVLRIYAGECVEPLLRVDDYPTGVRPILDDLGPIHDVLSRIDESGLRFHLGVVPALLDHRMIEFLRGLEHVIVSMHGYEHGYAKHSQRLREAGDPFNQRGTVGGFDEFEGSDYEVIVEKLRVGRRILVSELGQLPASYIPPTNAANRRTGRALAAVGFEYVLCERPIAGCELPCIRSDFYDRSSEFRPGATPSVATLHATWEADVVRAGDTESLPRFLDALVRQRDAARARTTSVAERIVSELGAG